jgi:GR25 family glycosyltransferase involved in LPS biosynthesis
MINIITYIIHYTKLVDRRKNLDISLEKLGIRAIYISEYDQEDLSDDIINSFYEWSAEQYSKKLVNLWPGCCPRRLVLPEISCTIKHLEALKQIANGPDNFGLILEDDVVFCDNFNYLFQKSIEGTPDNWDAIFFGSGCGEDFIRKSSDKLRQVNKHCFRASHPSTNCAEAYLIKKETANLIVNSAKPFHMVSDWEIAYQLYKFNSIVYWWVPSLIEQGSKNGMYSSTLDLGQRV